MTICVVCLTNCIKGNRVNSNLNAELSGMIPIATARQMVLSLPEVEEKSHFTTPDFRIKNKIFATLHEKKNLVMVKLNSIDQSVFCSFDKEIIYPVPGGWGRKGCTFVNLEKVKKPLLMDALTTAWKTVAPKKLVAQYFNNA